MTDTLTEAAVLSLDPEELGNILVRLGLLSHALGHDSVQGTLNPYLNHPELLSPEGWFVHDLLTHDTQRFIDRWYGGDAGALDMNAVIAARLLADGDALYMGAFTGQTGRTTYPDSADLGFYGCDQVSAQPPATGRAQRVAAREVALTLDGREL